jgi:hypothetical protein
MQRGVVLGHPWVHPHITCFCPSTGIGRDGRFKLKHTRARKRFCSAEHVKTISGSTVVGKLWQRH